MKISFEDVESAKEAAKLAIELVSAAMGIYAIVKKGIADSATLETASKQEIIDMLEAARLPSWEDL